MGVQWVACIQSIVIEPPSIVVGIQLKRRIQVAHNISLIGVVSNKVILIRHDGEHVACLPIADA
jgi:hypothetical protein